MCSEDDEKGRAKISHIQKEKQNTDFFSKIMLWVLFVCLFPADCLVPACGVSLKTSLLIRGHLLVKRLQALEVLLQHARRVCSRS